MFTFLRFLIPLRSALWCVKLPPSRSYIHIHKHTHVNNGHNQNFNKFHFSIVLLIKNMKPAGWNCIQLVHQISWNVFVLMIPNSGLLFGSSGVIMITFGQTIIYHEIPFRFYFIHLFFFNAIDHLSAKGEQPFDHCNCELWMTKIRNDITHFVSNMILRNMN